MSVVAGAALTVGALLLALGLTSSARKAKRGKTDGGDAGTTSGGDGGGDSGGDCGSDGGGSGSGCD